MWMCITGRRLTMCCPSGVGNAYTTRNVLVGAVICQVIHLPLGLIYIETATLANHGYAGAVVTTVLQAPKSFYQYRIGLFGTYITYYSTHNILF